MSVEHQNYIDGERVASETGDTFTTTDPSTEGDVVASYQQSDGSDALDAIEAAERASTAWAQTPAPERGRILAAAGRVLAERKREVTERLVREEGKTRTEASGEVQRTIDIFEYYGAKARDLGGTERRSSSNDVRLYTTTQPLGVVGLITPWNYPIAIPAWKLAPALVAGNTAVLKPASLAPGPTYAIVDALEEAGLPDGVLNVVTGPGSAVGSTIATDERVAAISFTGSTKVGNVVYDQATDDGKRVQLEMGGKNPTVVSKSADPDEAARIVADGAFGVTGQACTAASRAIVHESVHDEFVERLVERADALDIGPGIEDPDMGPHVSETELEGTLEYVTLAEQEGATRVAGGSALERDGNFVEPTVFTDVESDMRIAHEEVFGPLVVVIEVGSFEEAVSVANDVKYGLSASIVTNDHAEANRFVDESESGVVKVNQKTTGLELHVPFGGLKASSSETYREQGDAGLDFFQISKTVYDAY